MFTQVRKQRTPKASSLFTVAPSGVESSLAGSSCSVSHLVRLSWLRGPVAAVLRLLVQRQGRHGTLVIHTPHFRAGARLGEK